MTKKKQPLSIDQGKAQVVVQDNPTFPGLQPSATQPPPPEEGIGERIRKRREELRLNYEELSRLTALCDYWGKGLSGVSLARYEKGEALPGARELRLLCETLNLSPDWVLLGVDKNDQAKGAVALANRFVTLLKEAELFATIDPTARDDEWIWQEKLAQIRKPRA